MKLITLPKLYSQWDSRWGSDILGYNAPNSSFNIYNYGCLITCLAMINEYTGYSSTPRDVNNTLKNKNGFLENTGLYLWGSAEKISDRIHSETVNRTPGPLTDEEMAEIKNALDKKMPVMLQLDYDPKTVEMEMHYVLCVGYNPSDENDLLIADPLGGVERSLKHYLGWFRPSARNTIHQYIIYNVDAPATQSIRDVVIDWDDDEGKRKTCGWYVYEWFNEKSNRLQDLEDYQRETDARDSRIRDLSDSIEEISKTIKEQQDTIRDKSKQISDQKSEITLLKAQLLDQYPLKDLLKLVLTKIFKT